MKFDTVILCNVAKKMVVKKFQNCNYKDAGVTNYVNFKKKNMRKVPKICFFLKLTL